MTKPHYGPPDGLSVPRFSGIRTFARVPYSQDWANADVAVFGVPFDNGTSFRSGPRFGPSAIREMSHLLRRTHPVHGVDIFGTLSVIDGGDLATTPGNTERSINQIADQLEPVIAAGVRPLVLGGDHTVVLGELMAHARVHGKLGLLLLDAHTDTGDTYFGEKIHHGSPFRRAIELGCVDPHRTLMVGARGGVYTDHDRAQPTRPAPVCRKPAASPPPKPSTSCARSPASTLSAAISSRSPRNMTDRARSPRWPARRSVSSSWRSPQSPS